MIDFVLHFDTHLLEFVQTYGLWVYGLLFGIVFAETGLVVTPFLPGDSLLFAAGALAATGSLNPWILFALLATAAFSGNAVNYAIGRRIGPAIFTATDDASLVGRLMNRQYLERAHAFFEQYGGKAIILGRFVPIVRTFVPFVAGAGQMTATSSITRSAPSRGWDRACWRACSSATCRSSRTTSHWSRSASSPSRCCRSSSSTCAIVTRAASTRRPSAGKHHSRRRSAGR